ncbi:MAG TPA: hypothetical protein VH082_08040 [Rudaea sp.]|jgi:alpha-tubulin suppressor-like RCC1 family protein|nr:hypothetical protein [Rudaea sp.]
MNTSRSLIVVSLCGATSLFCSPLFAFPTSPHHGIMQLSAGAASTCALLADRHVMCWGEGALAASASPSQVPNITNAVSVASGNNFACALLLDQTIKCWGVNSSGQLGDSTFLSRNVDPEPVVIAKKPFGGVVAIAAGDSHACDQSFRHGFQCLLLGIKF